MNDTKNLIIAVILSTCVLFLWQYFYAAPKTLEVQRYTQQVQQQAQQQEQLLSPSVQEQETKQENLPKNRKDLIGNTDRIQISTATLHGSISLTGARLDDLTLANYKTNNDPQAEEVVLLSPSGSDSVYFAEFGWLPANGSTIVPNSKTIWHSQDKVLNQNKPITLSWDNNSGLKFYMDIEIDNNYMFKITRRVENYGKIAESIQSYGILNRTRSTHEKSMYISHEGAIAVLGNKLTEVSYDDLQEDKKYKYDNSRGWLGIADKYWLTTLIPDQSNSFDASFTYFYNNNQDRYQVDYLERKIDLAPGDSIKITSHLFTGPKKVNMLDTYAKELNLHLFDRAVDFGWLYFITKPIFQLLHFLYDFSGNFGLAILMLTILLKIVLFPLAKKSYISMHHLKRLQPNILDIKERYTNDKMAMNKAIMELYKTEKVSPMAGCLPLLIQLPIFFALYKVLYVTLEMRHAPFYGWISDLSAPDPTSFVNLFGLLPFNPPQFLMIGAWPLIMSISMYLQQKMNPEPTDPVQAKVIKLLPFIFLFLFANFAAGLVIYWAWNNILSILQQWIITRKLPKK
jgi:YidC/Oxa1 family membrane protein insertase